LSTLRVWLRSNSIQMIKVHTQTWLLRIINFVHQVWTTTNRYLLQSWSILEPIL
jgi:hypothetical protein